MMGEGVVVVGAAGSLGSALRRRAAGGQGVWYLFDQTGDVSEGIVGCDLAKPEEVAGAVDTLPYASHGSWRLLFASGLYQGHCGTSPPWNDVRRSLEVNLLGVVQFVTGFVAEVQARSAPARIVVVTSAAARVGSRDIGYGVAKAGLEGLVRSVSKSHARRGVTTIGLAPGLFPSAMSEQQDAGRRRDATDATHLGRPSTLDEVVECAMFALFDAPHALTGTFISPNGGQA